MKLQVICVRDIPTNVYMPPMFFHHTGQALRAFEDQCRDKANELGKHPEQYELWKIGTWDDNDGGFTLVDTEGNSMRERLAAGSNYQV